MSVSKINDLLSHHRAIVAELEAAASRVIRSGWYAMGPELEAFEQEFAQWCGVRHCRGVANGTDAIELALKALGVTAGSEVILAANAGYYSGTALAAIGAQAVYVDIDPANYCLDPALVEAAISPRTSAIIATHLYGHLCDMPTLRAIADRHKVPVLEDCAQAHGASLQGKKAGSWGDAAAFSFYPTKNLGALGDAGAVTSDAASVIEAVSQLRQYGWESRYKVVREGGRNSRLDELQAALLRVKLSHLDDWTARRQALGKFYSEHIRHPLIEVAPYAGERHVYHLYVLRCRQRDALRAHLQSLQIASDVHYPSLDYQQPLFAEARRQGSALPHSEQAVQDILTLPCYPELAMDDAQQVVDALNQWKP